MSVYAQCPACGEKFRRPDGMAGKLEKCPECRHVFRLPLTTAPPPPRVQPPKPEAPPAPQPPVAPVVSPAVKSPPTEKQAPSVPTPLAATPVASAPTVELPPIEQEPSPALTPPATPPPIEQEAPPAPTPQDEIVIAPPPAVELPVAEEELSGDLSWLETPAMPATDATESPPDQQEAQPFFATDEYKIALGAPVPLQITQQRSPLPQQRKSLAAGAEARSEPAKALDYAALAADAVRAGQSPYAVETELVNRGMDRTEAQQMVVFMSKACRPGRSEKDAMWLAIFGGLTLLVLNFCIGFYLHHVKQSPKTEFLVYGFAVIGLLVFLRGLWRLIAAARAARRRADRGLAATKIASRSGKHARQDSNLQPTD